MSLDALRSALALQRPDASWGQTHKSVLECLGDHANAAGEAFVCVATICDEKWVDRKAVLRAIADLREAGWIVDTGKRRGRTGQVIVWELPWIEHRNKESRKRDSYCEPDPVHVRPRPESQQPQGLQTEVDDAERAENAKGPESGTLSERVPLCPAKGPALSPKESPKRDTEPSTRLNPLPRVNPLPEGDGCASAHPPAREDRETQPRGLRPIGHNPPPPPGPRPPPPPGPPQRGKRMVPADWSPPDDLLRDLAAKHPAVPIELELEKFRDHSRANDRRFKDFEAAFRNWIRKAVDFAKRDGKGAPPPGTGSRKALN